MFPRFGQMAPPGNGWVTSWQELQGRVAKSCLPFAAFPGSEVSDSVEEEVVAGVGLPDVLTEVETPGCALAGSELVGDG